MNFSRIVLLSCIYFFILQFAAAQTPTIQWQKCVGGTSFDESYSVRQTADGGYVVAGQSYSDDGDVVGIHGSNDAWIVKFDEFGIMQWQKCLGGTASDQAFDICQTIDGGYIVTGATASNNGDVSGHHGTTGSSYDCWVVKLSSTGTIEWQKCLGGNSSDIGYSIQQTTDSGYIVAGVSNSINTGDVTGNHGAYDYWVVKLNNAGTIQWQKCLGGTGDDQAQSIQQTSDGGFIVAGRSDSNNGDVSGNHSGLHDYWVVKLDNAGTIQWQKCLGGTGIDQARSIQQTSDGGFIVAGRSQSENGDVTGHHGLASWDDYWVVKLNEGGGIQWEKSFGGTSGDYASSVRQTTDGGYIVAGSTYSTDGDVSGHSIAAINLDYWIVKLSSTGTLSWQKCYGGTDHDEAFLIRQTNDGGFIVTGKTYSGNLDVSGNHGQDDYWLVKLSSTGISVQLKCFIEGYYLGNSMMSAVIDPVNHPNNCDTLILSLADATLPYNIVYTDTAIMLTNGTTAFDFPSAIYGGQYYFVIHHRNALETWSALPVSVNNTVMSYDFSNSLSKAYGNNMRNLSDGNFALYSGDVNQDRSITSTDFSGLESATTLFIAGYLVNDITGDGMIESSDYSLLENNLQVVVIGPGTTP